ncbi:MULTISPECIES: SusD/RagB family nutrient-binding outer membrane lipoprotein [unclassified Myroides]|uniref:SusD/RagB family nutrient-binding outer membrane lipoprotein n=1 Tax=unclassified Myroides TaxID=2642485 RepID=UPI0015F8B777|nr:MULTISPECIES: SusD/RagB family nutrient-binding outer membrane lipoprotein [unclassified Myroides]MBB1149997.1 SusD/RagB family nutrient-binding outer membrane lipoprotein [Myroides sp. NP-2]MDM1407698.1 SusD/RagB family nutrient-binding outer membrane lipoprotein [Myroides sp. DF42-4-2]
MRKNKILSLLYVSVFACFALQLVGCTTTFDETNTDPNRLQEISPGTLLNPLIYEVATSNMYRSWSYNSELMQDIVTFPQSSYGIQHYNLSDNIGAAPWNTYYRWMKTAKDIEQAAVRTKDSNYEAIGITLRVWMASNLVDLFGDVPYFDAGKGGEGLIYPAFDDQEKIYDSLLADLTRANSLYDTKRGMVYYQDILFNNDLTKWQKFTNSLHLRLLLRISNKTHKEAYPKMLAILNDPITYPIISSSEEEATLIITGVTPNISPWSRIQDFTLNKKMASFFIDNLNAFKDPRLPVFATQATRMENKKKVNIGYKGIPSAFEGSDGQFDYEASTLNNKMAANPTKTPLVTYAEILFIQAELAQKGYITGAEEFYRRGVEAAMKFHETEVPLDYFANPNTEYDGTLERIMLQKYYALYMNDYQQWFEYKRTGFPKLPQTNAMMNDGQMPSRFPYPLDIRTKNKTNYQLQVQKMGGDDINVKIWWQN